MERYIREHDWIIDNNKRKTDESMIVYDEECNILDDICSLLNEKEQQLAEKDKEIKELKTQFDLDKAIRIQKGWDNPELIKSIRKQVCDEIKKELMKLELNIDNNPGFISDEYKLELKQKSIYKNIYKILGKIEQGE